MFPKRIIFNILSQILFVIFKLLVFYTDISNETRIGVFEINSLEELGGSKVQLVNSSTNEYHQLCDFQSNMAPGLYGFGRIGISPYLNITIECHDKLLAKNKYAKALLIYKIFRFRESDPIKEPTNKKLGVLHVYETFFQLFYYRANGVDKYTKVDVDGICGEKITLFLMHTLDNETMTTNFKNVQNQCPIKAPVEQFLKWYDTLNPNSDFYHSICIGYTYNTLVDHFLKNENELRYYDTPLDIRKKYFFGNLYLCPDFCSYSGIFSVAGFLLITCQCEDPKMDLLYDPTFSPKTQYMQPFDFDEKEFFATKYDSFFSIGVFGCFMFTFILGMQNNYGCYIILGIGGVIVFSYIELLIFGKKRILNVLEILYNNNINSNYEYNDMNNSKEKIYDLKNENNIIIFSDKGDLESNYINTNKNMNKNISNRYIKNNSIENKEIQNYSIQNDVNKKMEIQIKNNQKINIYNNKENKNDAQKPKEKLGKDENENFELYDDLKKKEVKIFSSTNSYNNSENKKNKIIKIKETNDEREEEEESEDSDKIRKEKDEQNEKNEIKNEEEEWEYEENEEEEEGGEEGEEPKSNPPNKKVIKNRQNINDLSFPKNELNSNQ